MLMKAIEFNSKHVNTMNVNQFDWSRTMFTVEELAAVLGSRQQNYQVLLDEDPVYCMETVFNVYRSEFRPIDHEDDWASYDGSRIQSNPRMIRVKRGRPSSTNIHNNMDDVEPSGEKSTVVVFRARSTIIVVFSFSTSSSFEFAVSSLSSSEFAALLPLSSEFATSSSSSS
ncbi:hypothetical protein AHAS_Ahas14G0031300 [Arachis hypogaea]